MGNSQLWSFYVLLAVWYIIVAGLAFLVFHVFFSSRFSRLKIQPLFPKRKDYVREVGYSFPHFFRLH